MQYNTTKETAIKALNLCIYFFIWIGSDLKHLDEMIPFYILIIIIAWSYGSSTTHPNCLNKEIFLCPMTKEEQKKYLLRHYWSKIAKNMVVATVFSGVLVVVKWMSFPGFLCLMSSQFLINVVAHLHLEISTVEKKYSSKAFEQLKDYGIARGIVWIIGIVSWFVTLQYATEGKWLLRNGMIVALSIQLMASLAFIKAYRKPLFRCAMDSELIYLYENDKKGAKKIG